MAIEFRDVHPIGAMKPWACSYTKGGRRYAITLYGTDAEQVLNDHCADLPGLTIDGELVAEGRFTDED